MIDVKLFYHIYSKSITLFTFIIILVFSGCVSDKKTGATGNNGFRERQYYRDCYPKYGISKRDIYPYGHAKFNPRLCDIS